MKQDSDGKQKRGRWDSQRGLALVEGWRCSGESASAYCRRQGIHESRLKYWRQVAGKAEGVEQPVGAKKAISFLPVVVRKPSAPRVEQEKMPCGVSPEWAARFVRELFGAEV